MFTVWLRCFAFGVDCVDFGFAVSILVLLDLCLLYVRFGHFRIGELVFVYFTKRVCSLLLLCYCFLPLICLLGTCCLIVVCMFGLDWQLLV